MLSPGWYIILYHDVSWEENGYVRSIGGTIPPDTFRQHVKTLASLGNLVSIPEGEQRLRENAFDGPAFSFWFDDGMAGVARYAAPILDEAGVPGTVSICSRFVNRSELFWRFRLSYLNSIDGMRFLRSRLRKRGLKPGESVRTFTLRHFSPEILGDIDELFNRFTTPAQRDDAVRLFMDRQTIEAMSRRGWTITNHTAAHYPVSEQHCLHLLAGQFQECEEEIMSICQQPSRYWPLPFDTNTVAEVAHAADPVRADRYLVFVRNRVNTPESCGGARVLYRFSAPCGSSQRLVELLEAPSPRMTSAPPDRPAGPEGTPG